MSRSVPLLAFAALAVAACEVGIDELPGDETDAALARADAGAAPTQDAALDSSDAGEPADLDGAAVEPDAHAAGKDASVAAAGHDAGPSCGAYAADKQFTCTADGNARVKCASGTLTTEHCPRGCLRVASADDVCMGTHDGWSCGGSWGTAKQQSGDYYLTGFGCWKGSNGTVHTDPGDNCIPGCFSKAKSAGICKSNETGPQCEERVNWYTADSGRFGCLARVRITNPKTGKAVVAVVLDAGPSCTVEDHVSKGVLDASGRVDVQLFGSGQGWSDKALVHVVEVDSSTPLGPVP